jgi:hypothetical protein
MLKGKESLHLEVWALRLLVYKFIKKQITEKSFSKYNSLSVIRTMWEEVVGLDYPGNRTTEGKFCCMENMQIIVTEL